METERLDVVEAVWVRRRAVDDIFGGFPVRVGEWSAFIIAESGRTRRLPVLVTCGHDTLTEGAGGSQLLLLSLLCLSLLALWQGNRRYKGLVLVSHGIVIVISGLGFGETAVRVEREGIVVIPVTTFEDVDDGVVDLVIGLMTLDILVAVLQRGDSQYSQQRKDDQTRGNGSEFGEELQDSDGCRSDATGR